MKYTTVTFQVVELVGTRRWVDADGKRRQKTKRFSQTINPFNKMPDGTQKTRSQIVDELKAERDAWLKEPL